MTEMNKTPNSDDRQKALKEVFLREIREELESDRSRKPSFEEFQKAVAKDRKARCKRHTAIAACFIVALLAGFFAFDMLAYDVDADKNPKEVIQTEDGVIIEDGGYGSSEEEDNVWVTEDWSQVEDAKTVIPNLLIPKYLPEEYLFDSLTIKNIINNDYIYSYTFNKKTTRDVIKLEIFSTNNAEVSLDINNVINELKSNKGTIFIQNHENKIATIQIDGGITLNIIGNVDNNEIIKIVNQIKN